MSAEPTLNFEGLLLSIVIPVYNREAFIEECLNSIINQPVDKSLYEIICIDDGSKDNSLSILKSYQEKYSNIKVFSQENQGASSARNHGIDKATGKYIWFIDSDDFLIENTLYNLILTIFKTKEELYILPDWKVNDNIARLEYGSSLIVHDAAWGNIVLTEIIKSNGIKFNTEMVFSEDVLFWCTVYTHCGRIARYVANIYNYRKHTDSIMGSANNDEKKVLKWCDDVIFLLKTLTELVNLTNDKNKKKNINLKQKDIIRTLLVKVLPYCGLPYKEAINKLKKEKLYPYSFDLKIFKAIFKVKGFRYKCVNFILWLFPLEFIYKLYFKKSTKHKLT